MTYLSAERPILYFGPTDSVAAQLIRDAHVGWITSTTEDLIQTVKLIEKTLEKNESFNFTPDYSKLKKYQLEPQIELLFNTLASIHKN